MNKNYNNTFGDIDLELLDLILKGFFEDRKKILDVGCGEGRNLIYFLQRDFEIHAIDRERSSVDLVKYMFRNFNREDRNILKSDITKTDYEESSMDAIICSRVLHFSESEEAFFNAWNEIYRILRPGGLLYLTMDSMIGFSDKVTLVDKGKWQFMDGSIRFLLNDDLLAKMNLAGQFQIISDIKTIHYDSKHAQTILRLIKK